MQDHDYHLPTVERAPLPPHERSWRHPSELAADTREAIRTERPSAPTRVAAMLGGTAAITLFGVAVLTLTPTADDGPSATGASPIQRLVAVALTSPPTTLPARGPGAVGPAPLGPLATAIGSGSIAVLPSRAVVEMLRNEPLREPLGQGPRIDVVARTDVTVAPTIVVTLSTGATTVATVVDAGDGDGLAILRLDGHDGDGLAISEAAPADGDIVTLLTDDPISVEWPDTEALDPSSVPDGTAVVDGDGELVGVYVGAGTDTETDPGRLVSIDHAVVAGAASPD